MSKRKLDAKNWLKDIGFDEATVDDLAAKFTATQLEKIAEGYMRQDDYDRMMNDGKAELTTAQTELAAANDRLNTEMAEWARVKAEGGQLTTQMRADLEAAQADALKARQALERIGQEHGIDVTKILEGMTVKSTTAVPAAAAATTSDLSGYVKVSDANSLIGSVANMALRLPATLLTISREHQDLFGQPLDTQAIVEELSKRANTKGNQKSLDPTEIWHELHGVAAKRAEVDKQRYDAAIAAAEQRGREAALSESALPGQVTAPGRNAPIFAEARKSVLNRPQPGERVGAAVAALRTGKYSQKSQKTA